MPVSNIKESFSQIIEELKDYIEAKRSLIELKAAQKGSPLIAKSIYSAILVLLAIVIGNVALLALIFAISLIFATAGTEAYTALSSLTFSTVCILVFFLLVLIILLGIRKRVTTSMETKFLSSYLDSAEQREHNKERQELLRAEEAKQNAVITDINTTEDKAYE